jgi:hypothetical protein
VFANVASSSVVCFKVFDEDQDGRLDNDELHHMANVLLLVRAESCATPDYTSLGEISSIDYDAPDLIQINFLDSVDAIIKNLEDQVPGCLTSGLTVEEYLLWAVDNPLTSLFQQLIFQVN